MPDGQEKDIGSLLCLRLTSDPEGNSSLRHNQAFRRQMVERVGSQDSSN